MVDRLEDQSVGVVGPAMRNLDGSVYPSARSFPRFIDAVGHAFVGLVTPNNPWSRRYLRPGQVEWVSGSAMLLRRDALDGPRGIGGFDEDYFMYVEDVDLCWRLAKAGWKVAYEPQAQITHHIGGSSERRATRMVVAHHRSLLRFEMRSAVGARRLLLPLVALGLVIRTIGVLVIRVIRRRPPATFHSH
jgi:N-acetylglucosaminyl-diphospho-decaprenol L-rhamnosyltransferase